MIKKVGSGLKTGGFEPCFDGSYMKLCKIQLLPNLCFSIYKMGTVVLSSRRILKAVKLAIPGILLSDLFLFNNVLSVCLRMSLSYSACVPFMVNWSPMLEYLGSASPSPS